MKIFRSDTAVFCGVFLLCTCLLLGSIGGWDLWNPDEPRYAQIAREMIQTGQYALPHLNAQVYSDKPPLYFWLIALASLPFGDVTAFSARLPSAVFGLGLILVTWLFAGTLCGRRTGLFAALILFCNLEVLEAFTSVHLDVPFSFFITLALYLFYCGYTQKKRLLLYGAYVCTGLAVSIKGPVGLVVPFLSATLFLWFTGKIRLAGACCPGRGLLIIVGIVAAWLVPAGILGGEEYLRDILVRQSFGRIVSSYAHSQPFYYYFLKFPFYFLPWSVFIPGACLYFWKNRSAAAGMTLPLCWFAGSLLFFSCMSGKRGLYLMPLYPAAAIVMARFFSCHQDKRLDRKSLVLFRLPALLIFAVFVIGGAAGCLVLVEKIPVYAIPAAVRHYLLPAGLVLTGTAAIGVFELFFLSRVRLQPFLLAAGVLVVISVLLFGANPGNNRLKSARPFCDDLKKHLDSDARLFATFKPELFNYYLNRYPIPQVDDPELLAPLIFAAEPACFLVKDHEFALAPPALKKGLVVITRGDAAGVHYLLVANKAFSSS